MTRLTSAFVRRCALLTLLATPLAVPAEALAQQVTPVDLASRFALDLEIHTALDSLDRTINRAIDVRDGLASVGRATAVLDGVISGVVQLDLHSSGESLLHETKLRSHLAYVAADPELAYAAPTKAQRAAFAELQRQAEAGEATLAAPMARARAGG